jgi:hypothetical protein
VRRLNGTPRCPLRRKQSICCLAALASVFTPLAHQPNCSSRRLRMHLEGLPRVIHGADFYFCVFFSLAIYIFWLTAHSTSRTQDLRPFPHVRECAKSCAVKSSGTASDRHGKTAPHFCLGASRAPRTRAAAKLQNCATTPRPLSRDKQRLGWRRGAPSNAVDAASSRIDDS